MSVTGAELVERAKELAPRVAARARSVEDAGKPDDETIQALIDAELIQTLVPAKWGGHQAGIETHVEIIETLALHAGSGFDIGARVRLKGQAGFLVDHCRSAVNEMMQHAGAASFRRDAPLQRFFRDLNTIATHAFWAWDVSREQLGRHRVGLDPNYPLV